MDRARLVNRQTATALLVVVSVLALTVTAVAGASKSSARSASVSNSLPALRTAPYALLGLERAHVREAAPILRAAGAVQISSRLAIWRLPSGKALQLIPRLQKAGMLRAFQPDRILAARADRLTAGDGLLSQEWWLYRVNADKVNPPGPGKPVTVIDSGLDLTHSEFFKRPNTTAMNPQTLAGAEEGHGTAVSSVIAAPANGIGLVGVYPEANLYSYDASPSGALTLSAIVAGLDRAARLGPGVVNLSLGGELREPLEEDVVLDAFDRGLIVVAAAGNSREKGSPNTFPANYAHVLTVAATDKEDKASFFSTQSRGVDLSAPGSEIPVAFPDSLFGTADGTSFAAPIVAGAAAWLWTARPDLDKTQVMEILRRSARDIGPAGRDADTGFGLLDIQAALAMPAPAVDPSEPNDDVDQVVARGIFGHAKAPLTTKKSPTAKLSARLDAIEDPDDVYRVWVGPGQRVTVTVTSTSHLGLEIWRPDARTVLAGGWHRKRNLLAVSKWPGAGTTSISAVNNGRYAAYFFVVTAVRAKTTPDNPSYDLSIATAAAKKK